MPLSLPTFSAVRRPRAAVLPAVAAALLLGGCGLTRPGPAVPPPPVLAAASAAPDTQVAPATPESVRALLARSDVSIRLIDAGRMQDLWAWAAPFLQASDERERILADVVRARASLGAVQGRSRAGARDLQVLQVGPESRMPPPGQYANVEYTAQRADGTRALERLSFRLEADGWRFTGYTVQAVPLSPQPPPPPPPPQALPSTGR